MQWHEAVGQFVHDISGQKASEEFSKNEAQKQRDWEEQMSNSAYQRAVNDMKKAGLNPAAMYGNAGTMASTPGGASASSSGSGNFGNVIGGINGIISSAAKVINAATNRSRQISSAKHLNWLEKDTAENQIQNVIDGATGKLLHTITKDIFKSKLNK